jgi:hypothetical protein
MVFKEIEKKITGQMEPKEPKARNAANAAVHTARFRERAAFG